MFKCTVMGRERQVSREQTEAMRHFRKTAFLDLQLMNKGEGQKRDSPITILILAADPPGQGGGTGERNTTGIITSQKKKKDFTSKN